MSYKPVTVSTEVYDEIKMRMREHGSIDDFLRDLLDLPRKRTYPSSGKAGGAPFKYPWRALQPRQAVIYTTPGPYKWQGTPAHRAKVSLNRFEGEEKEHIQHLWCVDYRDGHKGMLHMYYRVGEDGKRLGSVPTSIPASIEDGAPFRIV